MSAEQWTAVDRYLTELMVPPDAALDQALRDSAAAGLPAIQVAPNQGKLLHLMARMQGARSVLEIGTLGGYSTIWLARALPPGGRVVTLEAVPKHAAVARANLNRAGFDGASDVQVEIREGKALDTLPLLGGPFVFGFLDADKQNQAEYWAWALKLTRVGSVIVLDNVIREGEVANPNSQDPAVQGVRRANEAMARSPRVSATAVQTVGSKGYDGFAVALVIA
jgi:predicted O-methyltransferase YrrM